MNAALAVIAMSPIQATTFAEEPSIRFTPPARAVGDVMPFYHKGEYHLFYLLNATGNHNVNWEHAVSKNLVDWENLPPALCVEGEPTGPDGGCIFTGSIIEREGVFHAFYTSWNPKNPDGREFISHATSKDLVHWTKHPENRIAPDGIHYEDDQPRDFRDPGVVWDEKSRQYIMYILGNPPKSRDWVFGILTSPDLETWTQQPPITGVRGDECPDYFSIGGTHYIHGCTRYVFATGAGGPWAVPPIDYVERRMAAKRVFDGRRHLWFGGWLEGSMSIPRELAEGTDGSLWMKPAREVVDVHTNTVTRQATLQLEHGQRHDLQVPRNYLLEATVDLSEGQEVAFVVRDRVFDGDPAGARSNQVVISAGEQNVFLTGGPRTETLPKRLPINFQKPIRLQMFVCDRIVELFLNDQIARTFLVGNKGGTLRFEANGKVALRDLRIRTR